MNDSMDALQSQFRQLRLVETASELPELFRKAEQASWTYRELVQEIVCFELRKREEKSVQKRLKSCIPELCNDNHSKNRCNA